MGKRRSTTGTGTAHPYLGWWGLAEPPFQLEPDPRFAFEREGHREGLARMLFGLTQLGGIVTITGEIGCGKTMLASALRRTLTGDGFSIVGVANPPRTATGLLSALVGAIEGRPRGGSAARLALTLRGHFEQVDGAPRTIVVIDEAQRLDGRALEELRLLTNPGDGPGVPVVLLGQPELTATVRRLPQFGQRVVVRHHMGPMTNGEVGAYMDHRARTAGATRRLFSDRAAFAVHAETGGIPRLVNLLCANALFVGFARGEHQVGEDLVRDVADDRRGDEEAHDR